MDRYSSVQLCDAIELGLIVVDEDLTVLLWNEWLARHSGIPQAMALGCSLVDVFRVALPPHLMQAVRNVQMYGMPVLLSTAFHNMPLPLFRCAGNSITPFLMYQSIRIVPLGERSGERVCVIQIADASTSRSRETILQQHSERLKHLATTDKLTGIHNRRYFDDVYQHLFNTAKTQHSRLSVMIGDVDHFKHFNDTYGHQRGDEILARVAQELQAILTRGSAILARYGGEEFVVLLPDAPEQRIQGLAERMRLAIRDMSLPGSGMQIKEPITISIGVSSFDAARDSDAAALLRRADQALYRAKRGGRNQWVML